MDMNAQFISRKPMKIIAFVIAAILITGCASKNKNPARENQPICLYKNAPQVDYEVIRFYRVGKNSYGGVNDVLPKFVHTARRLDADAVINYWGSQRFGFWPWRFIRPVMQGTAVKWKTGTVVSCEATGGKLY